MKPLLPPCGRSAGLALALLLACSAAQAERPTVYRWLDESGVAHYTTQRDRIPSEFRDAAQEVGKSAPQQTPQAGDAAAAAPGARAPAAAAPASQPVASPPPPSAPPPSGPRVMPEGEFEEPPLGTPGPRASAPAAPSVPAPSMAPAAATAPAAPSRAPAETAPAAAADRGAASAHAPDVAAPPPGFVRGTAGSPAPAAAAASRDLTPAPEIADPAALDEKISALEEQVGRDEAALQHLLSQPREPSAPRLADQSDFREIAQRLPKLQADLKALRQQRTRQGL